MALTRQQIEFYREKGYLHVDNAVTPEQLAALRRRTEELIEASREVSESNDVYDLDEGHSPTQPRLTRIKLPHKVDPLFWDTLKNSRITEILRDLLGPNVMLQTSKLNTKAPGGGQAVEWHQDWAFYPATNDDLLAVGLMLDDVDLENGPLQVIPGTHRGPLLSHLGPSGRFCGAVDLDDPDFDREKAVTLTGKAGDMTIHHARILHGSAPNNSDRPRLILFYECAAADAWPLAGGNSYLHRLDQQAYYEDLQQRMIIGQPVLEPRVVANPIRIPLPPPPSNASIFAMQKSGGARSAFTRQS